MRKDVDQLIEKKIPGWRTAGILDLYSLPHQEIAVFFASNVHSTPEEVDRCLIVAVEEGNQKVIDLLLEAGADPSFSRSQALVKAIYQEDEKLVQKLIKAGAKIEDVQDLEARKIFQKLFLPRRMAKSRKL